MMTMPDADVLIVGAGQQQREVSRPAEAPIGEPDASDLNEFGGSRFMRSIGHEDIP